MQTAHKVNVNGGQDAGTLHDIQQIQNLIENMHASDVLSALKAGLASK